jgi:hypothetical protein
VYILHKGAYACVSADLLIMRYLSFLIMHSIFTHSLPVYAFVLILHHGVQFSPWFAQSSLIEPATEFVLSVFSSSAISNPQEGACRDIVMETSVSPLSAACIALERLLCGAAKTFTTEKCLVHLMGECCNRYVGVLLHLNLILCVDLCLNVCVCHFILHNSSS